MIENRSPRSDLLAVVLLVLVVFLSVSLITYDPADSVGPLFAPLDRWYQPDIVRWPLHEKTVNAFGNAGALASNVLYTTLGIGAWFLVAGIGAMVVSLLHNKSVQSLWARWIGWLLALCGLTTLATLIFPVWTPGPIAGPGGYLGALGAGVLKLHFAGFGGLVLAVSVLVIGLFLGTEYLLVRAAGAVIVFVASALSFALPRGSVGRLRNLFRLGALPALPRIRNRRNPSPEADDEPACDEDIAISTGRPSIVANIDDEQLEAAWDDGDEEEDDEDEAVDDDAATIPFVVNMAASSAIASPVDEEAEDAVPDGGAEEPGPLPRRSLFGRKARPKPVASATSPQKGAETVAEKAAASRPADERTAVMSQLDAAALKDDPADYDLPSIDLLSFAPKIPDEHIRQQTLRRGKLLEQKFLEFGYKVKVVDIDSGPVVTQYELELETGLRLSKIMGLSDDIAIGLRVPSVRIVAPIPGKNSVGIEVPNETRQVVQLRDVMEASTEQTRKMKIPLFLGQDVSGNTLVADLTKLPHLLIAGRTGTGKSVCLNAIISSILMTRRPDEVRMLMIDPKMVELSGYSRLPHLMHPVVTDMRKAEAILAWAVEKMEERYRLMARAGVRHLNSYNQLGEEELIERLQPADEDERQSIPVNMPYIVIVADEMADLMMTAGKEVEQHIIRLAQKSRAVGIHLIMATQKPTVDVVTGLIKSNLPARIAFQVASQTDSRVVLDSNGAEKLLGNGDMLFLGPGTSTLLRGQGTYLSDDEIDAITEAVSTGEQNFVNELVNIRISAEGDNEQFTEKLKNRDELYHRAVETVISEERGSVSLLQRVLGVGYGRAARLIDFMEEDGVVGPYNGSKSRDIVMTMEQWHQFKAEQQGEPVATSNPTPRPAPTERTPSTAGTRTIPQASTCHQSIAASPDAAGPEFGDGLEADLPDDPAEEVHADAWDDRANGRSGHHNVAGEDRDDEVEYFAEDEEDAEDEVDQYGDEDDDDEGEEEDYDKDYDEDEDEEDGEEDDDEEGGEEDYDEDHDEDYDEDYDEDEDEEDGEEDDFDGSADGWTYEYIEEDEDED